MTSTASTIEAVYAPDDVEGLERLLDVQRERLVLPIRFPETTDTAPNSPRQRAVVSTTP